MDKEKLGYKVKLATQRPRIKKTCSMVPIFSPKTSKLPNITTPRKKFESFNTRKHSVQDFGLRLPLLGPLPSLKLKTQNRDTFGESPILAVEHEEEMVDKDLAHFISKFRIPKVPQKDH